MMTLKLLKIKIDLKYCYFCFLISLLERLNLNDIKKCTPPPELVVEMERLDKIEKLTLDRVLQTSRMENMDVEL